MAVERMKPNGLGNHHVVVIGASAGGLQPLQTILHGLPPDLPASVFIVLHVGATSHLAAILGQASALPVSAAVQGEVIRPGHVYVAVPGLHLLIHNSHLLLRRGPRENFSRPAIDPLFRSAACTFGGAVIGVVLSGALNDGAAGLRAIKRCGGIAVVQDPVEAMVPSMPTSAQRYASIDHVATSTDMAGLLTRLVHKPAAPTPDIPADIRLETAIAAQELAGMKAEDALGKPSRFTCPECHGTLWEIEDGNLLRFRCHVGHAYTGEAVLSAQGQETEKMLWNLMRMHHERAELARRMAQREDERHQPALAIQLRQRAEDYDQDAELLRQLLRDPGEAAEQAGEQG